MSVRVDVYMDAGNGSRFYGGYDYQCTYNVFPMFTKAGIRSVRDFDGWTASDCIKPLNQFIERMESDPDAYKALNPPNGWGSYETALEWLKSFHDICVAHPLAIVDLH